MAKGNKNKRTTVESSRDMSPGTNKRRTTGESSRDMSPGTNKRRTTGESSRDRSPGTNKRTTGESSRDMSPGTNNRMTTGESSRDMSPGTNNITSSTTIEENLIEMLEVFSQISENAKSLLLMNCTEAGAAPSLGVAFAMSPRESYDLIELLKSTAKASTTVSSLIAIGREFEKCSSAISKDLDILPLPPASSRGKVPDLLSIPSNKLKRVKRGASNSLKRKRKRNIGNLKK